MDNNSSNISKDSPRPLNIIKYLEDLVRDYKFDPFLGKAIVNNINYITPSNVSVIDFLNSLVSFFMENKPPEVMVESNMYKTLEEKSSNLIKYSYDLQSNAYINAEGCTTDENKSKKFRLEFRVSTPEINSMKLARDLSKTIFEIFPMYMKRFERLYPYIGHISKPDASSSDLLIS